MNFDYTGNTTVFNCFIYCSSGKTNFEQHPAESNSNLS